MALKKKKKLSPVSWRGWVKYWTKKKEVPRPEHCRPGKEKWGKKGRKKLKKLFKVRTTEEGRLSHPTRKGGVGRRSIPITLLRKTKVVKGIKGKGGKTHKKVWPSLRRGWDKKTVLRAWGKKGGNIWRKGTCRCWHCLLKKVCV